MEIDLNAPVVDGDINPQEVIINPPHPLPGGDFLELNDFLQGNNFAEELLIQHEIPIPGQNELNLLALADEEMLVQAPLLPVNPVNVLDEEVPLTR
jgi:hypothetical protein